MWDYGGVVVEGNDINAIECSGEEFVTKENTFIIIHNE